MNWTADSITNLMGIALSLIFGIIPPVKRWFDAKVTDDLKPTIMFGLLVLTGTAALILTNISSWPAWTLPVFNWGKVWGEIPQMGIAIGTAFMVNYGTWKVAAKPIQKAQERAALMKRYEFPR